MYFHYKYNGKLQYKAYKLHVSYYHRHDLANIQPNPG
jgi:hypothetical protein